MERRQQAAFLTQIAYLAVVGSLWFLGLRFLLPLFWPFLFGLGFAYLFWHLANLLHARGRFAAAAVGVLFYCGLVLLFWLLFALLSGRLIAALEQFPDYYATVLRPFGEQLSQRALEAFARYFPASALSVGELFELLSAVTEECITNFSSAAMAGVTAFFRRLPLFCIGFVFMVVSSFAIAMDYARVTAFVLRQFPPRLRPMLLEIKSFLLFCLLRFVRAYLVIMFITFCELAVGLWALRVQGFWRIAMIVAVLDLLPLIGSGAVLVPWGLLELLSGRQSLGAGLLILYAIVALLRNIIEPRVVGDSLGLHPVVTLTVMFLGLRLFGLPGMLCAPIAALLVRFLNSNGRLRLYRSGA